jgi:hypothetical protein
MIPGSLSRTDLLLVAGLVLAVGLYAGSAIVTGSVLPRTSAAYAQDDQPLSVTSAAANIGGNEVGEVMVGDEVVLRIRTAAGGFSAPDRADIVADRLRDMVLGGLQPGQVHAGQMRGMAAVMAHNDLIITADSAHAELNNTSPDQLAMTWADNLASALGGDPGEPELAQPAQPDSAQWEPSEPYEDKDVPILSAGRGLRIGMARVSGPKSKVAQVQGVAQFESNLQDFGDVVIYVPISTKVPGSDLDRVNECAVVGLADIGL